MATDIERFRSFFPHLSKNIYLDHASVSPMTTPVIAAMTEFLQDRHVGDIANHEKYFIMLDKLRAELADLIHAESKDTIGFAANTTAGLNILAQGLDWRPGDHILIKDCEFPANVFPFLNLRKKGVVVDMVSCKNGCIAVEDLFTAVTSRTKLISLSYVDFFSGFRHNVDKIGRFCREHGIIFSLDAIQALGAIQLDVERSCVDFVACSGYKWLLSPMGSCFFYCSPKLLPMLEIVFMGWLGMENPFDFLNYSIRPANSSSRFETGMLSIGALAGMLTAVKVVKSIDPADLENRVLYLSGYLIQRLNELGYEVVTPENPAERAGIVLFSAGENNEKIAQQLKQRNISISLRENYLRVSPHFYNNEEDLDTFLDALKEVKNP